MKKYIFYSKTSKTKEPLGKVEANGIGEAMVIFSTIKNLEIGEFKKLFNVEKTTK